MFERLATAMFFVIGLSIFAVFWTFPFDNYKTVNDHCMSSIFISQENQRRLDLFEDDLKIYREQDHARFKYIFQTFNDMGIYNAERKLRLR